MTRVALAATGPAALDAGLECVAEGGGAVDAAIAAALAAARPAVPDTAIETLTAATTSSPARA